MAKITLKAETRKITGRKVKTLRKDGILPANIYGKNVKSEAVQVKIQDFEKVYSQAGETSLVEIVVGKKKRPVLIHDVQTDPVSDSFLHAEFLQVNLKEKVTAEVPVIVVGDAPAEKQGLGTVVQYLGEIEVEALPTELPDKFEVDAKKLKEVDKAILVKDIKVDTKKIKLLIDSEQIIAKVEPLRKAEEEEKPKEEVADEEGEISKDSETPPSDTEEVAKEEKGE